MSRCSQNCFHTYVPYHVDTSTHIRTCNLPSHTQNINTHFNCKYPRHTNTHSITHTPLTEHYCIIFSHLLKSPLQCFKALTYTMLFPHVCVCVLMCVSSCVCPHV